MLRVPSTSSSNNFDKINVIEHMLERVNSALIAHNLKLQEKDFGQFHKIPLYKMCLNR